MLSFLLTFLTWLAVVAAAELALVGLLMLLPRLGRAGRAASDAFARAPLLDVLVSAFTWLPWPIAAALGGWAGVLGALAGQVVALFAWVAGHEAIYREAKRGPRIVTFINRVVGRWRNHAALWVTGIALPGFLFIRFLEVACYPLLVWLLNFPRYRHADWVSVSRQKFDGLIGHDLIWCLYCDWMTGVYSLGAEMLRNVESFWCPIRFRDGQKCANCKLDFPDVVKGWVPADGTMRDVHQTLETMYGDGRREWFGHPVRLTVKGNEPAPAAAAADGNGNGAAHAAAADRADADATVPR